MQNISYLNILFHLWFVLWIVAILPNWLKKFESISLLWWMFYNNRSGAHEHTIRILHALFFWKATQCHDWILLFFSNIQSTWWYYLSIVCRNVTKKYKEKNHFCIKFGSKFWIHYSMHTYFYYCKLLKFMEK